MALPSGARKESGRSGRAFPSADFMIIQQKKHRCPQSTNTPSAARPSLAARFPEITRAAIAVARCSARSAPRVPPPARAATPGQSAIPVGLLRGSGRGRRRFSPRAAPSAALGAPRSVPRQCRPGGRRQPHIGAAPRPGPRGAARGSARSGGGTGPSPSPGPGPAAPARPPRPAVSLQRGARSGQRPSHEADPANSPGARGQGERRSHFADLGLEAAGAAGGGSGRRARCVGSELSSEPRLSRRCLPRSVPRPGPAWRQRVPHRSSVHGSGWWQRPRAVPAGTSGAARCLVPRGMVGFRGSPCNSISLCI